MTTPKEIRDAIRDLQTSEREGLTPGQRALVDTALGLLFEAYAQAVLDARGLKVDVSRVRGFIRYVNVIPLSVSLSCRPASAPEPGDSLAA